MNYPMYDMIACVILSFFFLAASSAWGHALSGLKSSGDPDTWIFKAGKNALAPICSKSDEDSYINTAVTSCKTSFAGGFGGANISVILGFLICFLFGANVYYLYKETRFANPNQESSVGNGGNRGVAEDIGDLSALLLVLDLLGGDGLGGADLGDQDDILGHAGGGGGGDSHGSGGVGG